MAHSTSRLVTAPEAMLLSIVSYGLAIGGIYALIGITYNVMFTASRVFSFTAGALGMLGGVLGSLFILRLGLPVVLGFLVTLALGALIGVVSEIVAVRPVLKSLDQHLYVLSTLALALMIQQFTAIEWSTEPQPFPRLLPLPRGVFDQQFWLPVLACAVTVIGLELLYRRTLVGRAFLAIAEDNYAARALGLPERNLRMASFALAGAIGALAGFAGGEVLLAFFANEPMLNFYGFVPVALGGIGNNRGAVIGGFALGLFQQAANYVVGGVFASVAVFTVFIIVLLARPQGLTRAAAARRV
jgi:branched-chain amino acid transport system permease protein